MSHKVECHRIIYCPLLYLKETFVSFMLYYVYIDVVKDLPHISV